MLELFCSLIIIASSADPTILEEADEVYTYLSMCGDDGLALVYGFEGYTLTGQACCISPEFIDPIALVLLYMTL